MFRDYLLIAFQLCAVLSIINASLAYSWTVSEKRFVYHGTGSNDYVGSKSWNTKKLVNNQGMLGVVVVGDPDPFAPRACPKVETCQAENCWASWLPRINSSRETGLYLSTYYTPSCPDSNWRGYSYFGVVPDVGFAMRSWTGMKPGDSSASFWRPNIAAPNKHIAGMYTTMRPQWIMQPWGATCSGSDCDDKIRVAIIVDHQVASSAAPSGTQLQQATRVVFLQEQCDRSSMPCLFEVNTKALCQGINCGVSISGADPAQIGMPYVGGVVGGPGKVTTAPNTGQPMWTSWGSATQHQPFDKRRFQIEITWNQLINILEAIDVKRGGTGSYESIAGIFGESWTTKSNWVLRAAGFGQEIYDPSLNNRAYVGGNVQRLKVVTISH